MDRNICEDCGEDLVWEDEKCKKCGWSINKNCSPNLNKTNRGEK